MKIKETLESLVMVGALALGIGSKVNADLIAGPAIPILGYSPNPNSIEEPITYISPDGKFILLTVWDSWPPHIGSKKWNSQTNQWGETISLGIPGDNSAGCLSPDGNTLVYASQGPQIGDIFYTSQRSGENWLAGSPIPNVNTANADHYPCFNGQQLYFTLLYHDLWVSDYNSETNGFSISRPVDSINTSEWREQTPWVSSDGKLLIFDSNRPGGYGDFDLWYATRNSTSEEWGNITNFGPYVNTSAGEGAGKIAEEANLLFFQRDSLKMQAPINHGEIPEPNEVPEPSTLGLMAAGGLAAAAYSRRRMSKDRKE